MNKTNWRRKDEIFKQKKHLGSGSFGRVQKCLNKLDGKTYALKLIENVELLNLETIQAEAEAMMRAKSDYTVELLDHFYDDETQTYVFVMPYYRKGNLTDYIRTQSSQRWQKQQILCFLYQICQAFLSFSREAACWHLDLKPDNVLVKSDGQYLICDFGCAKLVDNINNSRFLQISAGKGVGTTLFAPPQIIINYEGGKYSDVWSLGIMLYMILYKVHPIQEIDKTKRYPVLIKMFMQGKIKIDYPNIPGYEQIIQICKNILQPQRRLDWEQLRRAIYQCIGLPLKVNIVVNIQKFINFAQNISKIVMGLIFYLQKNQKYIQKIGLNRDSQKIISSCKAYVSSLYKQVQNTIQNQYSDKNFNKSEVFSFYIFPQIQKNYSIQEKQRLTHLRSVAQKFCWKQYNQNINVSFSNIKMNFECDIEQFLSQLRQKNSNNTERGQIHPIYEWQKIEKICSFIHRKSIDKYPGLQYLDRDVIEGFANQIVNQ